MPDDLTESDNLASHGYSCNYLKFAIGLLGTHYQAWTTVHYYVLVSSATLTESGKVRPDHSIYII